MHDPLSTQQILAIGAGGSLGALGRHGVNVLCSRWFGSHLAIGTLVVNVVGCFLIGLFFAFQSAETPRWGDLTHSALTVGFLGAFTTFSTFGFETTRFFENSQHSMGLLNIACHIALGLFAVFGGLQVGRLLIG